MQETTPPTLAEHLVTQHVTIPFMDRHVDIEYQWLFPERQGQPLVVFLHEGLGSVAMWKDWPLQLCEAAGCRGLVFSRYGYGSSTPRPHEETWQPEYLQVQAQEALPALFKALGLQTEKLVLFGHSDGGTIALLYAAMYPNRIHGIAVAAPHIFVEDVTVDSIRQARETYLQTDLADKLRRYHRDPDSAFWAWNDAWLNPDFRNWNIESYLPAIACPILAMQGDNDEYASLEQIYGIQRGAPQTELFVIPQCGHSPHRDQADMVIAETTAFIRGLE